VKVNIAVFASGSGTNAENLIRYFRANPVARVRFIVSNKPDAFVLQRAKEHNVESIVIHREDWKSPTKLVHELQERRIDLIVLAGFLWLVPEKLVHAYPGRIINIHPALLPKYGGKGMYGEKVHESVKHNRETETGITIHFVDKQYDTGSIIFQKGVEINPYLFSAGFIAKKVHELEYEWYPKVVEEVAKEISKNR
jgi:phosphoribosylglycinamide formyltransferase-1